MEPLIQKIAGLHNYIVHQNYIEYLTFEFEWKIRSFLHGCNKTPSASCSGLFHVNLYHGKAGFPGVFWHTCRLLRKLTSPLRNFRKSHHTRKQSSLYHHVPHRPNRLDTDISAITNVFHISTADKLFLNIHALCDCSCVTSDRRLFCVFSSG